MQFESQDQPLEAAIAADDADAVRRAIAGGSRVDARGTAGQTPLAFAVGTGKARAVDALLAAGADPNIRDAEGDSPVSIAIDRYRASPAILEAILEGGGDPNARRYDGAPIIIRFINDRNLQGIEAMERRGADLDIELDDQPLIVDPAIAQDWDVVRKLIELGARIDTPKAIAGLKFAFREPATTPPDSPLYPAKLWVYRHLAAQGITVEAPLGVADQAPRPAGV